MVTIKRIWESPTAATWASFAGRTLSLVLVLPMVLRKLTPSEFAIWSLFSTIISLQGLAELGFGVTFARVVAYAMGGAAHPNGSKSINARIASGPNWELLTRILGTMRRIYKRLGFGLACALIVGGTAALWRPIGQTELPNQAWVGWAAVAAVTLYTFHSNQYSMFLQGSNHVALLRRWEALFSFAAIASSLGVLALGGGLLLLTLSHQIWFALGAFRNRWLARRVLNGRYRNYPDTEIDHEVYQSIWPSAWRSGIGTAMSFGLIQFSGLFHAQSKDLASVNSYLLGLRLIQAVSQFSQAPFYSKLPMLARLYAEQRRVELVSLATRGMSIAAWSFVLPASFLLIAGPYLLDLIGSAVSFPPTLLWLLLTVGVLAERYGAMHLQLYSVTNEIIWHVANGVTGGIICLLWFVLYPRFSAIGLALGIVLGNLFFYTWYSSLHSHRAFSLPFLKFDLRVFAAPLATFVALAVATLLIRLRP